MFVKGSLVRIWRYYYHKRLTLIRGSKFNYFPIRQVVTIVLAVNIPDLYKYINILNTCLCLIIKYIRFWTQYNMFPSYFTSDT